MNPKQQNAIIDALPKILKGLLADHKKEIMEAYKEGLIAHDSPTKPFVYCPSFRMKIEQDNIVGGQLTLPRASKKFDAKPVHVDPNDMFAEQDDDEPVLKNVVYTEPK